MEWQDQAEAALVLALHARRRRLFRALGAADALAHVAARAGAACAAARASVRMARRRGALPGLRMVATERRLERVAASVGAVRRLRAARDLAKAAGRLLRSGRGIPALGCCLAAWRSLAVVGVTSVGSGGRCSLAASSESQREAVAAAARSSAGKSIRRGAAQTARRAVEDGARAWTRAALDLCGGVTSAGAEGGAGTLGGGAGGGGARGVTSAWADAAAWGAWGEAWHDDGGIGSGVTSAVGAGRRLLLPSIAAGELNGDGMRSGGVTSAIFAPRKRSGAGGAGSAARVEVVSELWLDAGSVTSAFAELEDSESKLGSGASASCPPWSLRGLRAILDAAGAVAGADEGAAGVARGIRGMVAAMGKQRTMTKTKTKTKTGMEGRLASAGAAPQRTPSEGSPGPRESARAVFLARTSLLLRAEAACAAIGGVTSAAGAPEGTSSASGDARGAS